MPTESTRLISESPTQYSSIPTNTSNASLFQPDVPLNLKLSTLYTLYDHVSVSKVLKNRGCVARDHLANERTYLAYLRTSLAMISTGVAVTQLFRMNKTHPDKSTGGRLLGGYLILLGIIVLLFAAIRFFHCQEAMTRGVFPVMSSVAIVTSVLLLTLCISMLYLN
ncbi:hypothetical protein K450DRAFT_295975 [Umbelopsis ramanniana AG]|uniref:DUF202 domain-containing protein n=1 Tax=Umbelopsis ramanniana AG TaxID=1314678 RepID=A0AAD5HJ76_UMBRA|nr:uncharacterized protein K450DRAFT_295975 [Umbelopsis ramanniana AG]KAI8584446.1 hypothetical protein K450DRAFT_295975 [Umbelopsis ramanniana AG]